MTGENNNSANAAFKWFEVVRSYLFLIIIIVILFAMIADISVIRRLSDPGFARGLITFLISVATIGIAFILIYQSDRSEEESYRRSREIFTGLLSILGTIVGFYFGSAGESTPKLIYMAEIQLEGKQLMTTVVGGTPPYRYSITSDEKGFVPIKDQISKNGWIVEQLKNLPNSGKITVEVLDSHDSKISQDYTLSGTGEPKSEPISGVDVIPAAP